jgi:hypothetical protein
MTDRTYTAFAGQRMIVTGDLETMVLRTKDHLDAGADEPVLIFEDRTGRQVDFDFRGTPEDVVARLAHHPLFKPSPAQGVTQKGPGRPNLGVVCREVSLLPRHWEWLGRQPGGSSAALRRLVDEARKRVGGRERAREARDAAGRFMWVMAGNLPGFEEATRALYAGDRMRLDGLTNGWPPDIRDHLRRLLDEAARLAEKAEAETPPTA